MLVITDIQKGDFEDEYIFGKSDKGPFKVHRDTKVTWGSGVGRAGISDLELDKAYREYHKTPVVVNMTPPPSKHEELRDKIAIEAMKTMLDTVAALDWDKLAERCYSLADAMIEEKVNVKEKIVG